MEVENMEDVGQEWKTVEGKKKRRERVPPIVLNDVTHWKTLLNEMTKIPGGIIEAKTVGSNIKVKAQSVQQHKDLYKYLESIDAKFYTHQLDEEKNAKIVIRGLPLSLTAEEIKEELEIQNFKIIKVIRLHKKS